MKFIACWYSMFDFSQSYSIFIEAGQEVRQLSTHKTDTDSLPAAIVEACKANDINKVKFYGIPDLLNDGIVADVKAYCLTNYGNNDIEIEVNPNV